MKANNKNEERVLMHFLAHSTHEQQLAAEAAGKTPAGAMKHAAAMAEKLPHEGGCVCVDDETVFAWTMRYFTDPTISAAFSVTRDAPAANKRELAAKPASGAPDQLELFGEGAA